MHDNHERHYIHTLFETKNFSELYQAQSEVINEMLSIENLEEFEDFLEHEDSVEEAVFWLHYAAVRGESLLIDGYEEDVTQKVAVFLERRLPADIFAALREHLQNI